MEKSTTRFPSKAECSRAFTSSPQTPEVQRSNSEGPTTVQITPKAVTEETPRVLDSKGTGVFTLYS